PGGRLGEPHVVCALVVELRGDADVPLRRRRPAHHRHLDPPPAEETPPDRIPRGPGGAPPASPPPSKRRPGIGSGRRQAMPSVTPSGRRMTASEPTIDSGHGGFVPMVSLTSRP